MNFKSFQIELKTCLGNKGLPEVLKQIIDSFNKDSPKYNLLISLVSDQKNLNKEWIGGLISYEQKNLQISSIRGRLLDFIDSLEERDISIEESFHNNPQIEPSNIDLPVKVLISINKMTPTIADKKLFELKKAMGAQSEKIKEASDQKEELARKAMVKIKALKQKGIKNLRLYKRYANELADAFKLLDQEGRNISSMMDRMKSDIVILSLYKVELAYSKGAVSDKELEEFVDYIEELETKTQEIIVSLNKKIEKEKTNINLHQNELKGYGIMNKLKSSIESKTKVLKSFIGLKKEWESLRRGILHLK